MISDATKIAIIKTAPTLSHIELIELVEHECELSTQRTAAESEDTRKTWVDLTDEEIDNINYTSAHMLAREVEVKLKEKNT